MQTLPTDTQRQERITIDRRTGDARRRELVRAAFAVIAERGFEGLRTREVAARAGVNIATLHYYFPAKEDLIRGVVDDIHRQFDEQGTRIAASGVTAWERLHAELAQCAEMPRDLQIVLHELYLRSLRDAAVHTICASMDASWHAAITEILHDGIREGSVRPDIDVGATAYAVMALTKGAMSQITQHPEDSHYHGIVAQFEQWLRADPDEGAATTPASAPRTPAPPGVPIPAKSEKESH